MLLIIFFYFFRSLIITSNSKLLARIFPNLDSVFSIYKFYFLAITLLVVSEYLIMFELPTNYLLSRVTSLFVMMFFTLIIYSTYYFILGARIRTVFLFLTIIISVLFGQIFAYRLQKRNVLRGSYPLGFFNYFLIASLLMGLSFINPQGFLFT